MGPNLDLYRGSQEAIDNLEIQDGRLYFSTDTKSIYLDCDYTDPRNNTFAERIKFGGSTGIFYVNKKLSEEESAAGKCIFFLETDFVGKNNDELPEIDDLILNLEDGSFYRVLSRNTIFNSVEAKRLTISGSGGTGGGGSGTGAFVQYEYKFPSVIYGTKETKDLPIEFTCSSTNEGAEVEVELYINNKYITTFDSTKISITDVNTINLADYLEHFNINSPTQFYLNFMDIKYGIETKGLNRNVLIYNMYLVNGKSGLTPPTSSNYDFVCYPWGGLLSAVGQQNYSLQDRAVYWELRKTGEISVVKKGSVLTNADRGSMSVTCTIDYPGPGEYTLTAWLQGRIPNSSSIVKSAEINMEIPFFDINGDPLITATSGVKTATQYDKMELHYMVAYGQSEFSYLKLQADYIDKNGVFHEDTGTIVNVQNSTEEQPVSHRWLVDFEESGIYYLSIIYLNNNKEETSYRKDFEPIVVEEFEGKPEITIADSLKLYLTAKGRSNSESERDSWTSINPKTAPFPNNSFTIKNNEKQQYFENFNWNTNGWITDGENNVALHLSNGAKLTIPFSPFTYNPLDEGKGLTIELDFKITNVRDAHQIPISCLSTEIQKIADENGVVIGTKEVITTGIKIYHNKAQLFSRITKPEESELSGRTTVFYPGSRVRLTYVITDVGFTPGQIVYTYLDGVISGLNKCEDNDSFKQSEDLFVDGKKISSAAQFIFDSTYMDIDLYNIRVYSTAQRHDLILNNNIADSSTPQIAIDRATDVDLWDEYMDFYKNPISKISLDKVAQKGNIPYMVFYDGRATGGKKDDQWYGYDPDTEKAQIEEIRQQLIAEGKTEEELNIYPTSNQSILPMGKKDYRHMEMYYVDPTRGFTTDSEGNKIWTGEYNIGSPEEPVVVTAYAQGTSSLEYPVKNIRFYLKPKKKFNEHAPMPTTQIEEYSLEDRLAPVELFTLKADYMESSSSHNTGTGNLLNRLYEAANITSPAAQAYPDLNILTAIKGHPIVCFFKPYKANAQFPDFYQYIGRYNFNLDKATHQVFGFEPTKTGGKDGKMIYGYLVDAEGKLKDGFNAATEYEEDTIYYTEPDRALLELDAVDWDGKSTDVKVLTFKTEKDWLTYVKTGPLYLYRTKEQGVSSVQCWECLNNVSNLVGMREYWDEEVDKTITYKPDPKNPSEMIVDHGAYSTWAGAFESRYPEYETEASTDKRALSRMLNWVNSTDRNPKVVAAYLLEKNGIEPTEEEIAQERANRLNEFKTHLAEYFDLKYLAFYYVITETLMMIDSRGKNMMLACFDADPEAGTGHWCPIFYDMDTMLGLENSGTLKFDYYREDYEADTFNLATTYSEDQYSVLWTNYREGCSAQIQEMYLNLRKKSGTPFSATEFRKAYNDNQADAWNELYINEDANYKFISPLINDYKVYLNADDELIEKYWADDEPIPDGIKEKTAADYLYAAQGTRSQHRDYWLTNRFTYLDSKYGYNVDIGTSKSQINCRVNSSIVNNDKKKWFNFDFDVVSLVNQYITIALKNTSEGGTSSGVDGIIGPIQVYSDRPTHIETNFYSGEDQEVYIYDMDNITSLGNLYDKGFRKFKLTNPTKFTELILGHISTEEEPFENADLGKESSNFDLGKNGSNAPLLEILNLENCSSIKGGMSLSEMPYLREVYAKGTKITSFAFADGGNIQHLDLPATIDTLTLTNQLYYNTYIDDKNQEQHLILANPKNLSTLYLKNSPNVDTKTLFESTLMYQKDEDHPENSKYITSITKIYMDNMNWEFNFDECEVDSTTKRISTIPLLDILMSIPAGAVMGDRGVISSLTKLDEGNNFISGTVIINNKDTGVGVDEMILYNKYAKAFPGLTFEYSEEGNSIKAYSININNNVQATVQHKKVDQNGLAEYTKEYLENWFTPIPTEYTISTDPLTEEVIMTPKNFDVSHIPDILRMESSKYKYTLCGWALEPHDDFQIDKYTNAEERTAAINAILKIKISHIVKEDGTWEYSAKVVNDFALTADVFNNQELNFYPVYEADLNSHLVYFYDREELNKILKIERVLYGHAATPPMSPSWIELDQNDITKTWVYPFLGYNLPYDNIVGELKTYATYGAKISMSELTGLSIPQDYFTVDNTPSVESDKFLDIQNIYKIVINADYDGEAIIIPKEITHNGVTKKIGSVGLFTSPNVPYCTTLRRIYFEEGNNIKVIRSSFLDSAIPEAPLCNQFEYLDFDSLTELQCIGTKAFQGGIKIKVTSLPNSVQYIGDNAFEKATQLTIKALPTSLAYLGSAAFFGCTGITDLDLNCAKDLEIINDTAFYGCSNLTINDQTILYAKEIGKSAFNNCSSLILNFNSAIESNVQIIRNQAFYNSALGLEELPPKITTLEASCFGMEDSEAFYDKRQINFEYLPATLTTIKSGVFFGRAATQTQWYLAVEDPTAITIDYTAFMGLANTSVLTTIAVPWDIESEEVLQAQPNLVNGWSHNDGIKVISSLN